MRFKKILITAALAVSTVALALSGPTYDFLRLYPQSLPSSAASGSLMVNGSGVPSLYYSGAWFSIPTTTSTSTLTNKTIDGDSNTVQDLPITSLKTNLTDASKFMVRDASGVPTSATKAVPSGVVVGDTDTQTLSSKTLTAPIIDVISATDQGSTPATPSAGTSKIYTKTDGKLYKITSAGVEQEVGTGASSGAFTNYMLNPDAETSDANVTDSSSIHSRSTSSPLVGVASHLIDASGSAQNVDFAVTSLEAGLLGTQCEALFLLSGDASLYTATVRINSSDVTTAQTLPNTGSYSQPVSILFPCGISGVSPVLRISSTSASAAAIKLDTIYFGRAVSAGNINQVGDVQSWTPTGSWVTNTTYTGKKWRVGDRGFYEVRILLSGAPTATNLNINMPSGEVIDTSKLSGTESGAVSLGTLDAGKDNGSSYPVAFSVLYGGSTTIVYPTILNVAGTYPLQASISATVPQTWASGDELTLRWSAPIVGWSSTSSYSLMNTYWKVDANISGANPSLGTSAVTSYTGITNGSLTLTNNSGTGNIAAQIGCSSTNSPTGTTCSSGDESVSVAFTPLGTFPQDVRACVAVSLDQVTGAGSGNYVTTTLQIVETATNAQTIIQEGRDRISSNTKTVAAVSNNNTFPVTICGTFTFTSPGQKMLRLMYEQAISGTPIGVLLLADGSASNGQQDIHWTAEPLSYNTPAPILVGGVTSGNTTGGERVERARVGGAATDATICSSTPCTIHRQSGSWLTSVTRGSTGVYTATWTAFSSIPSCAAVNSSNNANVLKCDMTSVTTTGASMFCNNTASGAALDAWFDIICMGAR